MRVLGIDPGVRGAAVLVSCGPSLLPKIEEIFDFQIREKPENANKTRSFIDILSLSRFISSVNPDLIYCEKMQPAPMIGVISAFSIGNTMGQLEALSALHNKSFQYVSPHIWKASLLIAADKDQTRKHARKIFGEQYFTRKADHNQAEAALIALYGIKKGPL